MDVAMKGKILSRNQTLVVHPVANHANSEALVLVTTTSVV
jgi:hypothetical protein